MQTHPILASTFLKDFHFPFDVLRIIRHHHERWDGTRLSRTASPGEAIPIESRIIHLVESFQMMTAGTPYRPAKTVAAALAELRRCSRGSISIRGWWRNSSRWWNAGQLGHLIPQSSKLGAGTSPSMA